jgi:hypothetical protein
MLKRGLVILVVVLIVLAIIGLLLPRSIHVERSVSLDPHMRQTTEGAGRVR